jgi:thioredoxin
LKSKAVHIALSKQNRRLWHWVCPVYPMATIHLTAQGFKDRIFNYETEQEWKYQGEKPAIIDFYADWCGPCKSIAPVLEELSDQYKEQIVVYKIDTDKELELSSLFGIRSIPTLLFIPVDGNPMVQKGALPKNILQQVIEEKLLQNGVQKKQL